MSNMKQFLHIENIYQFAICPMHTLNVCVFICHDLIYIITSMNWAVKQRRQHMQINNTVRRHS